MFLPFLFFGVIFYKFWLHNPEHIDLHQKKKKTKQQNLQHGKKIMN